jgi:hypothetical protein
MLPVMLLHVDALDPDLDRAECRLHHRVSSPHERVHRAVRVRARIHVENGDALHRAHGVGDGLNDGLVASFGEVRNAFDELDSHVHLTSQVPVGMPQALSLCKIARTRSGQKDFGIPRTFSAT